MNRQYFEIISRSRPFSVFEEIETWIKNDRQINPKIVIQLMKAIFQGEHCEQKKLTNTLITHTRNTSKINIPEDLMSLIFSYLQENRDEERTALIKQAERKFNERQQSQLSLNKE